MLFEFIIWQREEEEEEQFSTRGLIVANNANDAIEKVFSFYGSEQCPIVGIDFNEVDTSIPYTI